MNQQTFNLLAIVAVDKAHRVRCQQPHCGHGVYARIHVVEDAGEILVLGSDCFAKRYGVASTGSFRGFGGGRGRGRALTDDCPDLTVHGRSLDYVGPSVQAPGKQKTVVSGR